MFFILFYTLTISYRSNRGSIDAARELERFSAPVSGVLPGFISRRRRRAQNPFVCTRCGDRLRLTSPARRSRIEIGTGRLAPDQDRSQPIRERPSEDQATRIALRPHDPRTGEEIEKSEVVKGYEYGRGQFVTFTAEELKALDVES